MYSLTRIGIPPPPEDRPDPLVDWSKTNKDAIVLDEEADVHLVARVTEQGYASDLTDEEIVKIGRDPFLVAYALVDIQGLIRVESGDPQDVVVS